MREERGGVVQPAATEMNTLTEDYYTQYLEAQRSHWWFLGRERVLQSLVASPLSGTASPAVADVGSGPGRAARLLFPNASLAAFDISVRSLRAYVEANQRVVADAARLPCRSRSFSAVCAFDILEHLKDDEGALREWHRVLKPGGWLVLSVPAIPALWSRHDEANQHHRRYRAGALRRLLAAENFQDVRTTYFNTLLLPGIAILRWSQRLFPQGNPSDELNPSLELDLQRRFPRWIERCFESALRLEALWIRRWDLPIGISLGVVARARP